MAEVFADSLFWIALQLPRDQWRDNALDARNLLDDDVQIVTTTDVLSEFLAAVSRSGPVVRREAVVTVQDILSDPEITVVPQSYILFAQGLALYERRADKRYSLTDCVSMCVMRERGITEVLTHDRDFASEGFICLIR